MNWFDDGKAHIWHPYTQHQTTIDPICVEKTSGCEITLSDGRVLIDGIASWWTAPHGYNHPYLQRAVQAQLEVMPHFMFAGSAHEPAYRLAQRLAKLTGLDRVFFSDSGSTSVEVALKMAVQYWKNKGDKRRNKFVSFKHSYHGDTMGCMSLCDPDKGMHKAMNDYMPKQYHIPLPSGEYTFAEFDTLLSDLKGQIAGVVIEPLVQGAGGLKFHSADVLAEIYRITKHHDILFIADEVMTGFGRTGHMFACQEAGILPDIMCVGKALTGGMMTLAATLATTDVYHEFLGEGLEKALMSGPTYMANPLACAAANASLDLFEQDDRLQQVSDIERQLYDELEPCRRYGRVLDVRVRGAIGVVQLDISWDDIVRLRSLCVEQGVWLRPFADVLYIMPCFTIDTKQLSQITHTVRCLIKTLES